MLQPNKLTLEWDRLEKNSLMPSASHARIWLAPMFEHFQHSKAHLISASNQKLQAITALKKMTVGANFSIPIAQTWDNGFLFSGTPLICQENPGRALSALLTNARDEMGAKAVLFKKVQINSKFDAALEQLKSQAVTNYHLFNQHQRAALFLDANQQGNFDTWLTDNFSRKRRKEYRRVRNRLSDLGDLQSVTWQKPDSITDWIENFITLEADGWKGRNGTAIACSKEQSAHLRSVLPQMADTGSLLFWQITLDGKIVASLFGFIEHNQVWLGKIAYDESLAQYSPGVLLILDATKDLLARKNITLIDSSADPDHPMINNIWRDRINLADYLIATPGTSNATFKALVAFETSRLKARSIAKTLIHKLPGGTNK